MNNTDGRTAEEQNPQSSIPLAATIEATQTAGASLPPPPSLEPGSSAAPTPSGAQRGGSDARPGGERGMVAAAATAMNTLTSSGGDDGGDLSGNGMESGSKGKEKEGGASQQQQQQQQRSAKRPRDSPQQQQAPGQLGLPKSMVRRIMKLGEDTRNISNEALIVVSKASELFLEKFAARAFDHAEKRGRRLIKYQDVSDVRVQDTNLLFLEAVVPP